MAYGGIPPLWVFSEMTKPLVHLVGMEGYHTMVCSVCGGCV